MIELRTLGLVDLKDVDGREIRAVLTQPKRIALLAYLAVATPRGFHRRDTLLGLFWPELDQPHARASLRKAIHALRQALGDDALAGRGDEELALGEGRVWCDAVEFERALDDRRPGDALALYRGDFLEGFFISGARDFERWHDHERARLRQRAAVAAWAVAEERLAAGDDVAASQCARRALELAPDDEAALRRVIGLLYQLGDRAGALHLYNEFARRLVEEYGVQPSAETRQLVEQVKSSGEQLRASLPLRGPREDRQAAGAAPHGAAAPASQPARFRPARRVVLLGGIVLLLGAFGLPLALRGVLAHGAAPVLAVGAFHDYSARDTTGLARAIPSLLATNLARLKDIQVVSAARMLELMAQLGVPNDGGGDDPAAGLAARQAGATELVEGALYPRMGGGWRLDVERVELESGRVLAAYRMEGGDVFALVDGTTDSLAAGLGLPERALHVAEVTTSSQGAYRLYENGLYAYSQGDFLGAVRLFDQALQEDSTFAMAAYYAVLAESGTEYVAMDEVLGHLATALRMAEHTTERERLLIRATAARMLDEPARVALAETLVTRYPADPEGHLLLGEAILQAGDFLGALPHLRHVVDMDSVSLRQASLRCRACVALTDITDAYFQTDSFPALERTARRWVQVQPSSPQAWSRLAVALTETGPQAAAAAIRRAAALRAADPFDALYPAGLRLRVADFESADRGVREVIRTGTPVLRNRARWSLVISLRNQARWREALLEARRYRRLYFTGEPPAFEPAVLEPLVLLEMGRPKEAARLFRAILPVATSPFSPARTASLQIWIRAHVATALD